jgi:hypothetical protein
VTLNTGGLLTLEGKVEAVGARVTLNSDGGVLQTGGWLWADELLLLGSGDFFLDQPLNDVNTLAADIASSLTYRDWNDLTIGTVGGFAGILTHGGFVVINAPFGRISVNQPIDTRNGAGGILTFTGDVIFAAPVFLGAGNITLNGGPLLLAPLGFGGPPDQSGRYDNLRAEWIYDHMDELTYAELLVVKREVEELAGDPRWAQLLAAINTYLAAVVSQMEKMTFYKP